MVVRKILKEYALIVVDPGLCFSGADYLKKYIIIIIIIHKDKKTNKYSRRLR